MAAGSNPACRQHYEEAIQALITEDGLNAEAAVSVTPRAVLPLRDKIRSLDIDAARERILAEIDGDASPKY